MGAIGNPLKTASTGLSTDFDIGGTQGASGIYIEHTGHANVSSMKLGTAASVSLRATGNLTLTPAVDTAGGALALAAGANATLTIGGGVAAASIELEGDRMDWSSSNGIGAGPGLLWVRTASAGRRIDLGTPGDDGTDALQLSIAELGKLGGTGVLRIGSDGTRAAKAGPIHIAGTMARGDGGTLALETGDGVTQAAGAALTVSRLAVRALGAVALDGAGNSIAEVAADVADDGVTPGTLRVQSNRGLTIGAGLDGVSGIKARGLVALKSGGALDQSPGARIEAGELLARGHSVRLEVANAAGLVAGRATGPDADHGFSYRGRGDVQVGTVDGLAGVQAPGAVDLASEGHLTIADAISAGSITLKALQPGKDVRVKADLSASGAAGIGIEAARHVDFGTGSPSVQALGGPIAVTAGVDTGSPTGGVQGTAAFATGGGAAGAVTLQAAGDLSFGPIVAEGVLAGAHGGTVKVTSASGSVSGDRISARGQPAGDGAASHAGNGGAVQVTAGADVSIGTVGGESPGGIAASGGFVAGSSSGAAGSGSTVILSAGGSINVAGAVDASGGYSAAGSGGNGGSISATAANDLTLTALFAGGGSSASAALAAGGASGDVTLTASSGSLAVTDLWAEGGNGGAAGGAGGVVTLKAGIDVLMGMPVTNNGGIGVSAGSSTNGASTAVGANAGQIRITAGRDALIHGDLEADGGYAAGGSGAPGGTITVTAGRSLVVDEAFASGGWANGAAGAGGNGGSIVLSAATGTIDIGDEVEALGGGAGGSVSLTAGQEIRAGSETRSVWISVDGGQASAEGAAGGQGGTITFEAPGGAVRAYGDIEADGGYSARGRQRRHHPAAGGYCLVGARGRGPWRLERKRRVRPRCRRRSGRPDLPDADHRRPRARWEHGDRSRGRRWGVEPDPGRWGRCWRAHHDRGAVGWGGAPAGQLAGSRRRTGGEQPRQFHRGPGWARRRRRPDRDQRQRRYPAARRPQGARRPGRPQQHRERHRGQWRNRRACRGDPRSAAVLHGTPRPGPCRADRYPERRRRMAGIRIGHRDAGPAWRTRRGRDPGPPTARTHQDLGQPQCLRPLDQHRGPAGAILSGRLRLDMG